jgi:hypothetical protein
MRSPNVTPSEAPDHDVTVHIVLDDFGKLGRAYRETDEANAALRDVIDDLLTGQYSHPVGRLRYFRRLVVRCIRRRGPGRDKAADSEGATLPEATRKFIEFHVGTEETLRAENGLL